MRKEDELYTYWDKGDSFPLSQHFNSLEFTCHCSFNSCISQKVSKELIRRIEAVRTGLDGPITVTSGYRCLAYQASLTEAGYQTAKNSQHCLGNALDSANYNMAAYELALAKQFKALGIAKNFIHVDLRDDKVRRWTYDQA